MILPTMILPMKRGATRDEDENGLPLGVAVANPRFWRHADFSVDQSVRLEAGDQEGVPRLIQYFLRCPFSQARMIEVTDAGKVIYKTEHLPAPRLRPAGPAPPRARRATTPRRAACLRTAIKGGCRRIGCRCCGV
jgi:hypothetical protein